MATFSTWAPPQSWPTRSTGSPIRSSSPTSQSRYSVIVAPKPAGSGAPKPGGASRTTSRCREPASGSHSAGVSGLPCTNTAGGVVTGPPPRPCRGDRRSLPHPGADGGRRPPRVRGPLLRLLRQPGPQVEQVGHQPAAHVEVAPVGRRVREPGEHRLLVVVVQDVDRQCLVPRGPPARPPERLGGLLAGDLVADQLDRAAGHPGRVEESRGRRR